MPRDRHASFVFALSLTAAAAERLALEIRHLQRSEVGEVAEPFAREQKGSSAMPHKRNPVLSENLAGLARLVRAQTAPALENIGLWHERDISHSSVERAIFPDGCALTDFALARLAAMIRDLEIYPDRMTRNLAPNIGRDSQSVLLALIRAGMTRDDAYRLIQRHALAGDGDGDGDNDGGEKFIASLLKDDKVRELLSAQTLKSLADTGAIRARLAEIFDARLAVQNEQHGKQ